MIIYIEISFNSIPTCFYSWFNETLNCFITSFPFSFIYLTISFNDTISCYTTLSLLLPLTFSLEVEKDKGPSWTFKHEAWCADYQEEEEKSQNLKVVEWVERLKWSINEMIKWNVTRAFYCLLHLTWIYVWRCLRSDFESR